MLGKVNIISLNGGLMVIYPPLPTHQPQKSTSTRVGFFMPAKEDGICDVTMAPRSELFMASQPIPMRNKALRRPC